MIWRCPACRGGLSLRDDACACTSCGTNYDVVFGIPDLRNPELRDAATERDRADARELAKAGSVMTPEEMVREFFRVREGVDGWTEFDTNLRVHQTLTMPHKLRGDFDEWLAPVARHGVFLDVGCGLGGLLCAAESLGLHGIGIDNRLAVLIVAKRLIEREGGVATLACADAGRLPLGDEAVGATIMHDVIEHIMDLEGALAEANRVTVAHGVFAASTPNRFSVAAEPHVHVWGVGWLPRKYQARYVRWRDGREYRGTQLKSVRELVRILRKSTHFDVVASVAPIPAMEIVSARGAKKLLARAYNQGLKNGVLRKVFLSIGPFFQVSGMKRAVLPDIRDNV